MVDDQLGTELEEAIAAVRNVPGYDIVSDMYKTVPAGYDADHPRAELLKYKGLHAMCPPLDAKIATTPDLVDACFERCSNMAPIQQWLVRVDRMATG